MRHFQIAQKSSIVWLSLLALAGFVANAQSFPTLSDSPIYFIDADPAAYQDLSKFLVEHNAKSSLKAYVVVAQEILDTEPDQYIDRLSAAWQQQRPSFTEQDYLILALGLNHVIELKFAGRLEARYGVNGKSLLDRYFDSDWLPYARAGDYAVGLKTLVTRIEEFFAAKEAEKAAAAQRAEEDKKAEEARKAQMQFFQTAILPWLLLGLIVLVAVGVLLALRQRHLAIKRQVNELLSKTRERLAFAQSHLNEFYEKYKLLFEIDGEVIYKGRTFELYQSTSKLVNRLQLGVQLLAQQVAKAERCVQSEKLIGQRKLEEAQLALTNEKVVLTTDEIKAGQIKLFSSMNFSIEAQVSQLMDSLESYFAEAQTALDEIWNAISQSGPAVAKAKELDAQIESQLAMLRSADVAPERYEGQRAASLTRLNQAQQLLKTDPLSAREQALQAQTEFQAFHELLTAMLQIEASSRERAQQLEALRARVTTLRQQGFLLQEEGGPDPLCDHAAEGLKALRQALDASDKDAATKVLAELTELLNFIDTKLTQTVEAKKNIPDEAVRLRQRTAELRALVEEVTPSLKELTENFAPDSFKTESDNITEVTAALDQCEPHITLALSQAEPRCQEYLGAMELLAQVDQAQKHSEALLSAIPEKLKELTRLREQAQALHVQVAQKCDQLAQFVTENKSIVSEETDDRLSESQSALQRVTKALGESKPDWPVLLGQLQALSQTLDVALAHAQEERVNFQKLTQLSQELQTKLAITKKFLDEHSEDRAEPNSDFQKASEFFADIQDGLKQGKANWTELMKKAIRATELNELALSLAKKDVEIYQKAMSELRETEQKIGTDGRDYGYGVHADLLPARQALNSAMSALRAGSYEQALRLAEEAEHTAANVRNEAYEQARRLEQEFSEQRRKEEMARLAVNVVGALLSAGMRSSGGGGWSGGGGSSSGWSSWGSSSGRSSGWSSGSGRRTW